MCVSISACVDTAHALFALTACIFACMCLVHNCVPSQEPFNRIKKELLKEVKSLGPGERVLILGNSREPFLCTKKDEKAFMGFWAKTVFLPAPDYASRKALWPGLFSRHGGRLFHSFDLPTLAHISDGFSSGAIDMVVRSMLTTRRLERLKYEPITLPEVLQWLCKVSKATHARAQILHHAFAIKWLTCCGMLVCCFPSSAAHVSSPASAYV